MKFHDKHAHETISFIPIYEALCSDSFFLEEVGKVTFQTSLQLSKKKWAVSERGKQNNLIRQPGTFGVCHSKQGSRRVRHFCRGRFCQTDSRQLLSGCAGDVSQNNCTPFSPKPSTPLLGCLAADMDAQPHSLALLLETGITNHHYHPPPHNADRKIIQILLIKAACYGARYYILLPR